MAIARAALGFGMRLDAAVDFLQRGALSVIVEAGMALLINNTPSRLWTDNDNTGA